MDRLGKCAAALWTSRKSLKKGAAAQNDRKVECSCHSDCFVWTDGTPNDFLTSWRPTEPDDARKPVDRWRIYEYKNGEQVKVLHIHRQSAFLVGRIKDIADILTMHPSCSGQHAVLQFLLKILKDDLDEVRVVLPYVMDLESTNGTFLNGERLAPARYVELREKDMLKFGSSSREYVLIRAPA